MSSRTIALLAVIAAAVAGASLYLRAPRPAVTQPALPAAPALLLTDIDGKSLRTADLAGKVVLVNFWAAWCGPCADEVPQFVTLQKKYGGEGLQVLGFSTDDDPEQLRVYYRRYQINYPVVASNAGISDAYGGVLGLPTTLVIGRDGRIHARHNGATDFATLEKEVAALLPARSQ